MPTDASENVCRVITIRLRALFPKTYMGTRICSKSSSQLNELLLSSFLPFSLNLLDSYSNMRPRLSQVYAILLHLLGMEVQISEDHVVV